MMDLYMKNVTIIFGVFGLIFSVHAAKLSSLNTTYVIKSFKLDEQRANTKTISGDGATESGKYVSGLCVENGPFYISIDTGVSASRFINFKNFKDCHYNLSLINNDFKFKDVTLVDSIQVKIDSDNNLIEINRIIK